MVTRIRRWCHSSSGVEHSIRNRAVVGSIPTCGSRTDGHLASLLRRHSVFQNVRRRDSRTARRPDSATAEQRDGRTARRPNSATAEQRDGRTTRRPNNATAKQRDCRNPRVPKGARSAKHKHRNRPPHGLLTPSHLRPLRSSASAQFGIRAVWHPRCLAVALFGRRAVRPSRCSVVGQRVESNRHQRERRVSERHHHVPGRRPAITKTVNWSAGSAAITYRDNDRSPPRRRGLRESPTR
jgi:hypothetical protein